MCKNYREEDLELMYEDPDFCVVCFMNRTDVKVEQNICEKCMAE